MSLASLRGPGPLKYSYLVSSFNTFTRGTSRRVEVKEEEEEEKKLGLREENRLVNRAEVLGCGGGGGGGRVYFRGFDFNT